MTKMRRGRKVMTSLLAGVLMCQVSVFGVPQISENAAGTVKKMSFEVAGEGKVTVMDDKDRVLDIASGSVIDVPVGTCVRVQADAQKEIMNWKIHLQYKGKASGGM